VKILVVNAGSSSLKLRLLGDGDEIVHSADLPALGAQAASPALSEAISALGSVDGVGHRIVHGGSEFAGAVLVDPGVVERLEALTDLAPLHQPKSLMALRVVTSLLPDAPAVACFDTAFHRSIPAAAATYALPAEWRQRFDLRRFGFHGLSHGYASSRTADVLGRPLETLRIVTCHLGAGASLAAVAAGRSVDTTMGFTPLDGLVMATRSGSLDPGLLLWLEEHVGTPPSELADTLQHRSGLLGLSGTSDMRELIRRVDSGDGRAQLGLDVYLHRLRAGIASMAAAMGGIDALAFTGGVGENSSRVRELAVHGLAFLGMQLDEAANLGCEGDGVISTGSSAVAVLAIAAREDLQISKQTREVLGELRS
jgi:acetate kinase